MLTNNKDLIKVGPKSYLNKKTNEYYFEKNVFWGGSSPVISIPADIQELFPTGTEILMICKLDSNEILITKVDSNSESKEKTD